MGLPYEYDGLATHYHRTLMGPLITDGDHADERHISREAPLAVTLGGKYKQQ